MADLIERQAAIDVINALHDKPNAWLDCAVEAVEALPSAQPDIARDIATIIENEKDMRVIASEQRWILCSEWLPEYGTAVLTCDDYGECVVNHIIDEDDGEWFWPGVVAWLPLP